MNPISPYFIAFLAITVVVFHAIPQKFKVPFLALSSLLFAGFASLASVLILAATILFNHYFAFKLDRQENLSIRHRYLLVAIAFNAGLLALIKYHNILNRGSHRIAQWLDIDNPMPPLHWLIPLGLSYYVFQAIGYQVEVYRGNHKPEPKLEFLATYLSFFPKLTAGPIERSGEFFEKLRETWKLKYEDISHGCRLILWGFFKFMFVSNSIKSAIDPIFQAKESGWPLFLAMVMYTVQLYAEFSGYTDIALGSARLFGIQLRPNFNTPFRSTSLSDFWRRWHMSLSTWVMEYVFKPLSMWFAIRVSAGKFGVAISVFLSFLLLGIWHGTSWSFALFGLIQGTILALEISTQSIRKRKLSNRLGSTLGWVATMLVFVISSLFFKAEGLVSAFDHLYVITAPATFHITPVFAKGITIGIAFIYFDQKWLARGFENWINSKNILWRWAIYTAFIYSIVAGSGIHIPTITYSGF